MRLLRLIGLLVVTTAAVLAVYLFYQRSLSDFFPVWLLDRVPGLYGVARWLPADLLTMARWLALFAALGFGLIAPSWRGEQVVSKPTILPLGWGWRLAGRGLMALSVASASAAGMWLLMLGSAGWQIPALWAGAILSYLLGAGLAASRVSRAGRISPGAVANPERSWPLLLVVLAGAALLFSYSTWTAGPTQLDDEVARWLLPWASLWQGETPLFTTTATMPPLALALFALITGLSGDVLLGLHLSGLFAALLIVVGVWLLGCELFRRTPLQGPYEESLEDAGQWPALVAAGLAAASPTILHFSRLPIYLEPVAWGVLSLWALVRGLRTGDTLAVALAGALAGVSALLYPTGLLFVPVALCWWLGVWLLQPGWLHKPKVGGRRWLGVIWLGALVVVLLPQVVLWVQTPSAFVSRFEGFFLPDPSDLLALLGLDLYRGEPLAFPSVGLLGLLAPILILALGNLLLNLDRLPGWALFTWTLSAVALGSALAPQPQFWPAFLPLLPALALTLAFALDRLRAALLTTVGSWLGQATTYLALGLVIWVALLGWVADQEFLQANGDPVTATGLLLHSLPPNRTAVLVLGQRRESVNPQTPVLQLLGQPALATHQTLLPESWPATLPQQSSVVIQPEDQALVDEVQSRYPGGQLVIQRDRRGNPLLFIYRLP